MDRRQKKSREAIFRAFSKLLERKRYEYITVQEIIDEADVGRSTFYSHFETKDMLLKEMCSDIFDHIFAGDMCAHETGMTDLQSRLSHILWHLKDHKADIIVLLSSESGDLFMRYLGEYLTELFRMYLSDFSSKVPEDFLLNHLVYSFCAALKWWVKEKMETSPEQTSAYFIAMTETHV